MITDVINLVNKPSHYIENVPLHIANMSNFFAPFIVTNGNGGVSANCEVGLLPDYINTVAISVQPNPCSGTFYFQLPQFHTQVRCQLLDINGGVLDLIVPETTADTQQYRVMLPNNRSAGIYLLKILADNQNYYAKIAVNN
ncbi:MAG: T9SS type A sorting domain-containing protein [Sphingobacteriales bacterium]|nr:T9SS type A sorting domain-containing protein [Sphingobacteriales bacterium]